jgi:endonuclease/exonuclease/phosphatase (EEP) superfamily protein YafD
VEIKPFVLQPRRMSLHAIIDVEGQLIDLLVVHLMPDQFTKLNGQSLNLHTRERFNIRRVEVTDLLIELQHDTQYPAVVLCDCNFAETSEVYRMLAREVNDVHREIGWGFGKTAWSDLLVMPVMRVDYIWYSDALTPIYTSFGDRAASNHRPLIATFVIGE